MGAPAQFPPAGEPSVVPHGRRAVSPGSDIRRGQAQRAPADLSAGRQRRWVAAEKLSAAGTADLIYRPAAGVLTPLAGRQYASISSGPVRPSGSAQSLLLERGIPKRLDLKPLVPDVPRCSSVTTAWSITSEPASACRNFYLV